MTFTAYALSGQAAGMYAAPEERPWAADTDALSANPAWRRANGAGWELCCPQAFEATWNGGPDAADIEIRREGVPDQQPSFVQSRLGAGILTFHTGYQIKTAAGQLLWVRGPINAPRDGLYPLESMVDASLLPCTVLAHWQFTRPHQAVRFAAGEPFCTILPYAEGDSTPAAPLVIPVATDSEADEPAFEQLVRDPAVQDLVRRLGGTGAEATTPAVPGPSAGSAECGSWATRLIDPPAVSCICPTHGRVELLEEAIYSFLRQDYPGRKELIVLNDYDQQTLVFEHPDVHVVNVARRFHSIGEKYRAAVALASHDLIFVWHDDDISLPHRLSYSIAHFAEKRGFFKADCAWFWNDGRLSGPEYNRFHGASCWSRALFIEAHGYPHLDIGYDGGFEERCDDARPGATASHRVRPEDVYYLYRWAGTGSYHLSTYAQTGREHEEVVAYVQQQVAREGIRLGTITLSPGWTADYPALVRDVLNAGDATRREDEIPFPPPYFAIPAPKPLPDAVVARLFRRTRAVSVSVILPAFNESVLLRRTVEQFEATLPDDGEIIVVDNGSLDGSADFLLERHWPRVSLVRSPRPLGVAGARNRGLADARGEVIVFADAHIDIPALWWQPMVAVLNRPRVGVVGPGIGVMGRPELPVACGQRIAEPNLRLKWLPWKGIEPCPVPTLGGGWMAMRRETLEHAGAFDEGMAQWGSEDMELCIRYWLLGYEVWVAPEVTVLHYFRAANPLTLRPGIVTHNLLRVALLHFNKDRIARVTAELQKHADFGQALAHAVDSDVWQRRAALAERRERDDDWLFHTFRDTCPV